MISEQHAVPFPDALPYKMLDYAPCSASPFLVMSSFMKSSMHLTYGAIQCKWRD